MNCAWCSRKLGNGHGYSEAGEPICASYSATPNKAYSACKARAHRLREKQAKVTKTSATATNAEIDLSRTLTEALQIIITQNDELISLQRQQLAAPRQLTTETKVISTTTFEAPEDIDIDIEIKQDKSTNSVDNFLRSLNDIQNIQPKRML